MQGRWTALPVLRCRASRLLRNVECETSRATARNDVAEQRGWWWCNRCVRIPEVSRCAVRDARCGQLCTSIPHAGHGRARWVEEKRVQTLRAVRIVCAQCGSMRGRSGLRRRRQCAQQGGLVHAFHQAGQGWVKTNTNIITCRPDPLPLDYLHDSGVTIHAPLVAFARPMYVLVLTHAAHQRAHFPT